MKEELSGLEGVEVKGIDLRSKKEGYAYLSVGDESSLTLAKLKQAVKNTPFEFVDVQWVVSKPRAAAKEH